MIIGVKGFVNIDDIDAKKKKYCKSINEFLKPYNIMGIYGIYLGEELIYIGQSKNIGKRWVTHKTHIIKNPAECKKHMKDCLPLYNLLRTYYLAGMSKDINFSVLKFVDNKDLLLVEESKYINKFKPKYNIRY